MRKLGHLLSGLFLVLVFVLSIIFSYFNTTPVSIGFANWEFSAQPISVWIIGAFVSGGFSGLLLGLGLFRQLRTRAELRRTKKQLEDAEMEITQLRTMALQDLK